MNDVQMDHCQNPIVPKSNNCAPLPEQNTTLCGIDPNLTKMICDSSLVKTVQDFIETVHNPKETNPNLEETIHDSCHSGVITELNLIDTGQNPNSMEEVHDPNYVDDSNYITETHNPNCQQTSDSNPTELTSSPVFLETVLEETVYDPSTVHVRNDQEPSNSKSSCTPTASLTTEGKTDYVSLPIETVLQAESKVSTPPKKKMGRPRKDKNYPCEVCNKIFSKVSRLNRHFLIHTDLKPFQCDICNKCFKQKSEVYRHYLVHSGKTFSCSVCEKCFSTKDDLSKHNRTHTGEMPFQCDVCQKRFSQKCNLNTHYRTHTKEKPYECDVCHKSFSHKNRLNTHNLIHTNDKPYECDVCNMFFSQKSYLTRHYRRHTLEKPFECDICLKCFSQKSILNRHYRTHTGVKPHHCDICNKSFSEKCNLTTHYRVHTEEKPYSCDVCNQWFRKQDHLVNHYRIHTKEKPYKCDECQKDFSRRSYLTAHFCEATGKRRSNHETDVQLPWNSANTVDCALSNEILDIYNADTVSEENP